MDTLETLPPLQDDRTPQTVDELWAGFNPRAEPVDVEILKAWEEDGIVLQVLRYRIGIFKGKKAMMAGVYGYPKDGRDLPGLVQIHGGGQYANANACLTNAKRGYATISISWAGRIEAPDYRVTPDEVKLFWEDKTDDPNYRVITDWGSVDGYHHPCRCGEGFGKVDPDEWTLDASPSPRNNSWFLCALGARRGLTFLEQQPEVDGDRLGVYGHSMGGKLAVMVAGTDNRVKAAAPSCGGISHRQDDNELLQATICDDAYLKHITCPIIFLSPANDFHGRIDDLPRSTYEIQTREWRATCAPHHNHQDTAPYEVATQVWMDHILKKTLNCPQTPRTNLDLRTADGTPSITVTPDRSRAIRTVEVYYTQQGQEDGKPDDRDNTMNRFWHYAATTKQDDTWTAELPILDTDRPLWVYANVLYELDAPISGAGFYYGDYTAGAFNLSSLVHLVSAAELKEAGVKASRQPALMIETFEGDWEKAWFTYRPAEWARTTHKVYDPQWAAPGGTGDAPVLQETGEQGNVGRETFPATAKLALEVRCDDPNTLVVTLDTFAAEVSLLGGSDWQHVTLSPRDFRNPAAEVLEDWSDIKSLRLSAQETLWKDVDGEQKSLEAGAEWKGEPPTFRNLQWRQESSAYPTATQSQPTGAT
jgi:hypothetical protein